MARPSRPNLKVVSSQKNRDSYSDEFQKWIGAAHWMQAHSKPAANRFLHSFNTMIGKKDISWQAYTAGEHSALRQAGNALLLNPSNRKRAKTEARGAKMDLANPPSMLSIDETAVWRETFIDGVNWLYLPDTFLAVQYCVLEAAYRSIDYDFVNFSEKRQQQLDAAETSLGLNTRGQKLLGVELGGDNVDRDGLD